MSAILATWRNGQIIPDQTPDWPEGMRLEISDPKVEVINAEPADYDFQFMTEEEQGDDPESIQRWIERVRAIPPMIPPTPEEQAAIDEWNRQVKEYTLAAVRKQFEEGI